MNLNSNNFTQINSTMVIHWDVNEPIDLTNHNFTQLIFSNYTDINICIEISNNYIYQYEKCWKGSEFNKSLNLTNNLKITHLSFGYKFNQSIDLTNNIQLAH